MRKAFMAALAAILIVSMSSCGYVGGEQTPTETTTTTELTIPTMPTESSAFTMPEMTSETTTTTTKSEAELKKLAMDTFLAEFYSSKITFEDTSKLVSEVVKTSPLDHKEESKSGKQIVTVKGKSGSGNIDVMRIDLTKSGLDYEAEYLLTTMGDHYFDKTINAVKGISKKDFSTNYKMTSKVVSKGKYQQYANAQKTDGTANQFGYVESYAVIADNKLTVVTGHFVSTDINERQNFCKLLDSFRSKLKI
ncbi:MAG: hypothetical protein J6I46_00635 [Ruminococcus sp.]|nr:hypothetical protein [Ruminococcus sp.]